ncbi:MAG: HNH endonuclease [Desulfovibrionaceae bacterium]|nr:HNH endonuclease [Desulfovibrionaceae bacterium]
MHRTRDRRFRKTRYRKSGQVRSVWLDRFCNPKLRIEVGKFDTAKMINPDMQGVDYQHGPTYGYYDEYTCQVCKKKNKILHTHHIIFRSYGGTDRADNLITVCYTSENQKSCGIFDKWMEHKKTRTFKKDPKAEIT